MDPTIALKDLEKSFDDRQIINIIQSLEKENFRLEKFPTRYIEWSKNLLNVKSFNNSVDENELKIELTSLFSRIESNRLGIVRYHRDSDRKRRKGMISELPSTYDKPSNFAMGKGLVLQIGIYPSTKIGGLRIEFEMLASEQISKITKFLSFELSKLKRMKLFSDVEFRCPASISGFRKLLETCSSENLEDSWLAIQIADKVYQIGCDDFLTWPNSVPASNITWSELSLRLNEPYNLIHTGMCSHILLVQEIRCFNSDDHALQTGPRIIRRSKEKRRVCTVCDQYNAVVLTVDDRLAPENPCAFCKDCFESLHFNSKGRIVYDDFSLYPYIGDV